LIQENLPVKMTGADIIQSAIRGMLKEVDPQNGQLISRNEKTTLYDTDEFNGGSTGLDLTLRNNAVTVISPIPDSPAEKIGIRPNDIIIAIDRVQVKSDVLQAIKLLRGSVGTTASVTVSRAGASQTITFQVERRNVHVNFVRLSTPTPDFAVLKITHFNESTLQSVASTLANQWGKQKFKGVILDLRRNTGGLFRSSIGIASLFLPRDSLIAETRGKVIIKYFANPQSYSVGEDPLANVPPELRGLPLVVLVDEGTASGAEIVVAALKDHNRAHIVGRTTFGRNSVETTYQLNPTQAVKFTSSKWYPPSGESINEIGITPDHLTNEGDFQRDLETAISDLKSRIN
jgi:carboxyl-terminal processing protease